MSQIELKGGANNYVHFRMCPAQMQKWTGRMKCIKQVNCYEEYQIPQKFEKWDTKITLHCDLCVYVTFTYM